MTDKPYTCYGVIDLAHHDTTPGSRSPLAPPVGWEGDDDAYLALMRRRYRKDPGVRQHLALAARCCLGTPVKGASVSGPYRVPALSVLDALARRSRMPRPANHADNARKGAPA